MKSEFATKMKAILALEDGRTFACQSFTGPGEVMGIAPEFGAAYDKAQFGTGQELPVSGTVFISVTDKDKPVVLDIAAAFRSMGFHILATQGTAQYFHDHGIACRSVHKISMGRPNVVDAIKNDAVQLIVNTGIGRGPSKDGYAIRRATLTFNIPYTTTMSGADAVCRAISSMKRSALSVGPIQDYYGKGGTPGGPMKKS